MKHLFLVILAVLAGASLFTWYSLGGTGEARPLLSWQTGICPDRYRQVELFREWMILNRHTRPDGQPLFDIRIEAAGNQSTMIQAVSGMAGDLIDFVPVESFAPMGVLEDITDFTRANKMDPEHNYPGSAALLCHGGQQYAYPRNLAVFSLYQNLDTFQKYGVEPPPEEWSPEEFERIGVEFMAKANAGLDRRRIFFCAYTVMVPQLARSRGIDIFNETLTAAELVRPELVEALELQKSWVKDLHLMPDAAERADESAESVIGDPGLSQFIHGRYAMMPCGRYIHMTLRDLGHEIRTANSLFPQYEFRNAKLYSSNTAIYRGSRYKEEAKLFLRFLAEQRYNEFLIATADGLPPNPGLLENNPDFLTPKKYPWEGATHGNELKWAKNCAYPDAVSPWYKGKYNPVHGALERYMNDLASAKEALRLEQDRVNRDIRSYAMSHCAEEYREACARQEKIDQGKAAGRKIPAEWVTNSFLKAYYSAVGMLE